MIRDVNITDTGSQFINKINDNFGEIENLLSTKFPATECLTAFVAKMNEVAKDLGCSNITHFSNPSGIIVAGENHKVTANDFIRITSAYSLENNLLALNTYRNIDVVIHHQNGTNETVTLSPSYMQTTGESAELNLHYDILGGKTGSWYWSGVYTTKTLTILARSKVHEGKLMAGYLRVRTYNTNSFDKMKLLFDALEAGSSSQTIQDVTNAAACYVPFNVYGLKNVDYVDFSLDGDIAIDPASTTKLLTNIIVCKYLPLDANIEIIASDIQIGSGITLSAGDKMSVRDAIIACMYSSSNTLATTLGRVVGGIILNNQSITM